MIVYQFVEALGWVTDLVISSNVHSCYTNTSIIMSQCQCNKNKMSLVMTRYVSVSYCQSGKISELIYSYNKAAVHFIAKEARDLVWQYS